MTMTSAVRAARAISPQDYIARFAAERARLQRHYCNLFEFWRACRDKRCRRALRCCGDANECLKNRIGEIPRRAQFLAREAALVSTPHNAGGAERTVRQFMPRDVITPDPLPMAMNSRKIEAWYGR
jgi:hypothetical protein